MIDRYDRFGPQRQAGRKEYCRDDGAVDRDRILYSEAFCRLPGITQVASTHEGHLYHNRLTHSLKVGQLCRRISEQILYEISKDVAKKELVEHGLGGLDPEVTEAAAYAHDVGTPPFGHNGEAELDCLLRDDGVSDGFEGNAQSFRSLTFLESHKTKDSKGLNLTRATLRAVLKYPWLRVLDGAHDPVDGLRGRKWGAYGADREAFEFAMQLRVGRAQRDEDGHARSLEAEIMDWADDVTYAVHDLEDFYRAGCVPLDRIHNESKYSDMIFEDLFENYCEGLEREEAREAWRKLRGLFPPKQYDGRPSQKRAIYRIRANCIKTMANGLTVEADPTPSLRIETSQRCSAELLKKLTFMFVINGPALAMQQRGQRALVRSLFEIIRSEADHPKKSNIIPAKFRNEYYLENNPEAGRLAADVIASLTEPECYRLHERLTGLSPGSLRETFRD
jgi:dGTPase